jgi:hypothetical protein
MQYENCEQLSKQILLDVSPDASFARSGWCRAVGRGAAFVRRVLTSRWETRILGGAREPTLHRICVYQTGLLELKVAVCEYGEVRDALHVVPGG